MSPTLLLFLLCWMAWISAGTEISPFLILVFIIIIIMTLNKTLQATTWMQVTCNISPQDFDFVYQSCDTSTVANLHPNIHTYTRIHTRKINTAQVISLIKHNHLSATKKSSTTLIQTCTSIWKSKTNYLSHSSHLLFVSPTLRQYCSTRRTVPPWIETQTKQTSVSQTYNSSNVDKKTHCIC